MPKLKSFKHLPEYNMMWVQMPMYTPYSFAVKVDDYLDDCLVNDKRPTNSWLIKYLKITKTTLYNYKKKPEYAEILELFGIHRNAWMEENLVNKDVSTAWIIFWLKNENEEEYKDKQEVTHNTFNITRSGSSGALEDKEEQNVIDTQYIE